MNRVYRVVWCHIRNTYVVASELASRKKVKSSKQVSLKAGLQVGAVLTAIATMGIAGAADVEDINVDQEAQAFSEQLNSSSSDQLVILNDEKTQVILNKELLTKPETETTQNVTHDGYNFVSIVLGPGAVASDYVSTSEEEKDEKGNPKKTTHKNIDAIVIGNNAKTDNHSSIAIGTNAISTQSSVVIGSDAKTTDQRSVAIGTKAESAYEGTVIGYGARAISSEDSTPTDQTFGMVAVGGLSTAQGKNALALGYRADVSGHNSTSIGGDSKAVGSYTTAIGATAHATGGSSIAIGATSSAEGYSSIAIGTNAETKESEHNVVSFGNDKGVDRWGRPKKEVNRRLIHVDKGRISENSTDAINGSQLYASNLATVEALGGGAELHDGTIPGTIPGSIKGPSYVFNDKQYTFHNVGDALYNLDGRIDVNKGNITNILEGKAGLVKLGDKNDIVFDADLAKDRDTFNVGDRKISNLAAGVEDKDAVNVSQLKEVNTQVQENITNIEHNAQDIYEMGDSITAIEGDITLQGKTLEGVAKALGGGSSIDSDTGKLSMPNYKDALGADPSETVNDGVNGGFEYVGGKLTAQGEQITNIDNRVTTNEGVIKNITEGTVGLVKVEGDNIVFDSSIAGDRTFDISNGTDARTLTGVEKANLSVTSTDAVNGSQLFETNELVAENTSNISNIDARVTTNEGNIGDIQGDITNITAKSDTSLKDIELAFGGKAKFDADGNLSMPNYADALGTDSPIEGVEEGFRYVKGELTGISTGAAGLIKLATDGKSLVVDNKLAEKATSFNIANGDKPRTLTGVEKADLSATSTDAVNGSQLFETNELVAENTSNISNIDARVTTNEGNIGDIQGDITNITAKTGNSLTGIEKALGGDAKFDDEGNLTMPNYKDALTADKDLNSVEKGFEYVGGKLTEQGEQITNIDGRVTTNEGDIKNITSGKAGLVQLDGDKIVIDNVLAKDATSFDLHNGDDTRKITGVSAGTIGKDSTDAITGGQLYDTGKYVVDSLGGTALVDAKTGEFTGPDFADSLGIKAENGTTKPKITTVAKGFEYLSNNLGDLNTGKAGLLQLSDDGKTLVFSDAANSADTFDLSNDGKTRTLTSVTAGKVAETSTDAINGSQLHATNKSIVDALGGGSQLDENGNITGPTYNITNNLGETVAAKDVGTALETIDGNVVNNTENITSLTNNVNNINNGTAGLVKVDGDKIVFDSSIAGGRTFNISNNGEARTLTGVKDGALAADSKDAVNGGQLHATNQNVAQNSDNVGKLAESLGGGASVGADGKLTGPTYTFTDNSVHTNVGSALENLDGRVDGVEKKVDGIANGTAGLVKLSDDGKSLVIDNGLASKADTFDLSNGDKDRTLTGVADGKVKDGSKDAINGGQLHASNNSIADIFGGGASVDKDGYVSMPSYELGADKPFNNVGDSLTYLSNSMKNGDGGLFKLDRENNQVILEHKEINEKTTVNIGNRVMTGVANGNVAEGSLDAVNGGQLWTTNQQVSSNTNQIKHIHNTMNHYNNRLNHVERTVHQNRKVASAGISGAMAMSSIPYVEHTKYSLGMGVASYDGEAAMSIGLTFKVGDNGRFRIQGSYDTQNKMGVGAGIAFEL